MPHCFAAAKPSLWRQGCADGRLGADAPGEGESAESQAVRRSQVAQLPASNADANGNAIGYVLARGWLCFLGYVTIEVGILMKVGTPANPGYPPSARSCRRPGEDAFLVWDTPSYSTSTPWGVSDSRSKGERHAASEQSAGAKGWARHKDSIKGTTRSRGQTNGQAERQARRGWGV